MTAQIIHHITLKDRQRLESIFGSLCSWLRLIYSIEGERKHD